MTLFHLTPGRTPVLVGIPHGGTDVPEDIADRLVPEALALPDTDWHLARLYDFLADLGIGVIAAASSRYVIDLNRPPGGESLYPGQATTGLIPTSFFDGRPLYRDGAEPDAAETEDRRRRYWQPYHDALAAELARLKAEFGIALLYDAHSIRSEVPRLFDGRLPDFNLGTARGAACAPQLEARLTGVLRGAERDGFTHVVNGRFVGGYITRTYGRPDDGIHAVQMEQSQITYMDEIDPFPFNEGAAARSRPVLRRVLDAALAWADEQRT